MFRCFPSGKTCFSPDEMTLRALPSGKNHDLPDGRPLRLAHQNHFGSQCAPQSVYWHRPAKVKLKKAHFGKLPSTERVLRHPPCPSESAEPPQHFAEPTSPQVKPKQPDDRLPEQRCLILREPAIHHEDKVASQNNNSREARNTYNEGAAYFGGTSPLTATNVATPGGLPAFPYFAAAKYTDRPAH